MENKTVKKAELRLKPLSDGTIGTIIVFNTVQQGMYGKVLKQVEDLKTELEADKYPVRIELFTVFGPFDNVIRFDIDDFCLVNRISSLAGVYSQQIQCAYPIWSSEKPGSIGNNHWKPFCCITQLKVQNHLMLGHGPEIEEAIASLLAECMETYLEKNPEIARDLEVELMATLGWDEFFIFMRNSRGYASMFKPILKEIRPLTLKDLEGHLGGSTLKLPPDIELQKKHLFLSTYSTPGYCMKLSQLLEGKLKTMMNEKGNDPHYTIPGKELEPDELFKDIYPDPDSLQAFGSDSINVSTRMSIKPGHWDKVSKITRKVLEETRWWREESEEEKATINRIFSIGRYDVYPWLDTEMSCKEFVTYFTLLLFSMAGNLEKEEEYKSFLTQTQFYNSFTIISYQEKDPLPHFENEGKPGDQREGEKLIEGTFISQLENLSLGHKGGKSILQVFEEEDRAILRESVPRSFVIGLSRIFSLFDSCLMDRFTCDSFLDMYPFMQRVREIIDTVKEDDEKPGKPLVFKTVDAKGKPLWIELPESWGNIDNPDNPAGPLVTVFYFATERFYRGFVHRYLASYPMMDKNETGVDFSGRLHRILSATTGMQNLLLDDLDCHNKKGFNSISTYPSIRIYRDSFNTTEANLLHLFQVEMFYSLYHEIIHTFIHSKEQKGESLLKMIEEGVACLPDDMPEESRDIPRLYLEEITGDLLLMKNAFYGNFGLFTFWYWLMLIQCKKKIDSQIILRFLVLSYTMEEKYRKIIHKYSNDKNELAIAKPAQLVNMINEMLPEASYPPQFKKSIISRITSFADTYIDIRRERDHINHFFDLLTKTLYAIYPKLDKLLESYCYPTLKKGNDEYREHCFESPLRPPKPGEEEDGKRQGCSIRILRCLLTFIYDNREKLLYSEDGIINFYPGNEETRELRRKLFKCRVALINTLQWESLRWKKTLLTNMGIDFPLEPKAAQGK